MYLFWKMTIHSPHFRGDQRPPQCDAKCAWPHSLPRSQSSWWNLMDHSANPICHFRRFLINWPKKLINLGIVWHMKGTATKIPDDSMSIQKIPMISPFNIPITGHFRFVMVGYPKRYHPSRGFSLNHPAGRSPFLETPISTGCLRMGFAVLGLLWYQTVHKGNPSRNQRNHPIWDHNSHISNIFPICFPYIMYMENIYPVLLGSPTAWIMMIYIP